MQIGHSIRITRKRRPLNEKIFRRKIFGEKFSQKIFERLTEDANIALVAQDDVLVA